MNLKTNSSTFQTFREGMRDAVPISLGYLAVSFSLGIAAKNAGLTAWQGFFASLLNNASAGEYAGFTVIQAAATYFEMFLVILIANSRYLIMSCALSQKFSPQTPWYHRILIGFDITDELFAINIARPGLLKPAYAYGAMSLALPSWAIGTALGIMAGNMMPLRLTSAFSVALYGMFLAVIIPPARQNKIVAALILISFITSFAAGELPVISELSSATRTIILTLAISAAGAFFFPIKNSEQEDKS